MLIAKVALCFVNICKLFYEDILTVIYVYPSVLIKPAVTPTAMAPYGFRTKSATVPTATPPANVAFCT